MAYINTNAHQNLKQKTLSSSSQTRQSTLNSVLETMVKNVLHEGGNIPLVDVLCHNYLLEVFEHYLITIKQMFSTKRFR
ncbi:3011_t:CDS:2 [Cetraspora pellucida]|uniref:3011_t:CDS:1 n=1 Tax=Cetraspora pellucida TaxID=1433469 RepID=A0A9N9FGD7_9GLOM|nr:3011_t:CDS:2 [Cetraspora pellucida]